VIAYKTFVPQPVMIAFWIWQGLLILAFVLGEVLLGQKHHMAGSDHDNKDMHSSGVSMLEYKP
jgi:hypothetical protein